MTEECIICGELATPWVWSDTLQGHICCNCAYDGEDI